MEHIKTIIANIHILIHTGGEEYLNFLLRATTKRTYIEILFFRHYYFMISLLRTNTLSIIPYSLASMDVVQ